MRRLFAVKTSEPDALAKTFQLSGPESVIGALVRDRFVSLSKGIKRAELTEPSRRY